MAGTLYGVGIGPGDPELMTLKAVRILKECDIIGIPAKDKESCTAYKIALEAVNEIGEKPVIAVPVPMTTDGNKLKAAYDEGSEKIARELEKDKNVAFLNLGDPVVYGTYMKIHKGVTDMGYNAEIVSGVPSFCATAAVIGIPLGQGNEEIHILPGYYNADEIERYRGTTVLMKSAGRIDKVRKKLIDMEKSNNVKAYAVTNCGMEGQMIYRNIEELREDAGYFTTIVVKEKNKIQKK